MTSDSFNQGLIGHWPLAEDFQDRSVTGLAVQNHGVELTSDPDSGPGSAAGFNGASAYLEIQDHPALNLGNGDFSIAAWVRTEGDLGDVVGDVLSKFDTDTRKGLQLSIVTNGGMTYTSQSNYRSLHFGIDDGRVKPGFTDCGRPGNAAMIAALKVFDGALYTGTFESGARDVGRVWRYEGGGAWTDLGSPDGSNIVNSLAEWNGRLYSGTGRYWPHGSAMGDALNNTPGGKMYRLEPDGQWVFCGHPGAEDAVPENALAAGPNSGKADDLLALTVFRGGLYCTSNHRKGVFKYQGDQAWAYVGLDERVLTLAVYRDSLFALTNKGGPVYRYEGGTSWAYCGRPGTSTETYAAAVHCGELYVGTWPEAEVFRFLGGEDWTRIGPGPVGYEREIMGMALYNGKVYVGSLPMANVWRMDDDEFAFIGTVDNSPAFGRRAWTMAVYDGRLFVGTLPSGRVLSLQAGAMATWDRIFPTGWHHVVAVKNRDLLNLFVDGKPVAVSTEFTAGDYDLNNDRPLLIGFGVHDYFSGHMSDVRLYNRALADTEIRQLSALRTG